MWISSIHEDEMVHYKWAHRNYKMLLRKNKRKAWASKASTFHHHLCQIGAGKYAPKETISGHYFIFRLNGSIRRLDSRNDPSAFFLLFCRGLFAIERKGEDIADLIPTSFSTLEPNGIVAIGLKDFEPWRFHRHTSMELRIGVDDDLLSDLKRQRFYQVCEQLYVSGDKKWKQLKLAADLLYQFHENEFSGGYAYTKSTVSTVLLCSAAESLLGVDSAAKKRNVSTLIAATLFPKGGTECNAVYELLEKAYSVRNGFVHAGQADDAVENKLLFHSIFCAWLKLAHLSLKHKEEKDIVALIKKRVRSKASRIYRDVFFKDYLSTDFSET